MRDAGSRETPISDARELGAAPVISAYLAIAVTVPARIFIAYMCLPQSLTRRLLYFFLLFIQGVPEPPSSKRDWDYSESTSPRRKREVRLIPETFSPLCIFVRLRSALIVDRWNLSHLRYSDRKLELDLSVSFKSYECNKYIILYICNRDSTLKTCIQL